MRLDKLAVTAQEAFQAAMGVAGDADTASVDTIHLLKALLDSGENNLSAIIKRVGADPDQLKANVETAIANGPKVTGGVMGMPLPALPESSHPVILASPAPHEYVRQIPVSAAHPED